MGFHLLDTLVHGWGIAAAVGTRDALVAAVEGEEELLSVLVAVTEAVPDTPEARAPGGAFRPGLPPGGGTVRFERVLALLGRARKV